jgi:hypothetical protein
MSCALPWAPARTEGAEFAMDLGAVDAMTIGYKNAAEIGEAVENLNLALNG